MFTLIKFLNKLSDEDRIAGLKFLLTSLKNSANEGCEKVWKELRNDYASGGSVNAAYIVNDDIDMESGDGDDGGTTSTQELTTLARFQPPQLSHNSFPIDAVDDFDTENELKLVKWSIDHGASSNHSNADNDDLNENVVHTRQRHNYQINGELNDSLIPYYKKLSVAKARRERDRTLIYEIKYQELLQLLFRVNCPLFKHFEYKECEEKNQVVAYTGKTYNDSYSSFLTLFGECIDDDNSVGGNGGGSGNDGRATLTEIGLDDERIDDQSTRQTDDIMDDDSQTGDTSVDGGASIGGNGSEQSKDDRSGNEKKKRQRQKGKVTTWTCHQCPKV